MHSKFEHFNTLTSKAYASDVCAVHYALIKGVCFGYLCCSLRSYQRRMLWISVLFITLLSKAYALDICAVHYALIKGVCFGYLCCSLRSYQRRMLWIFALVYYAHFQVAFIGYLHCLLRSFPSRIHRIFALFITLISKSHLSDICTVYYSLIKGACIGYLSSSFAQKQIILFKLFG